jgi:tetratricopeptide (TPR) repeat protein
VLKRAADALSREPNFSLSELMGMNDASFYFGTSQEVLDRYALSYAALEFAQRLSPEQLPPFKRILVELVAKSKIEASRSDAEVLDRLFRAYLNTIRAEHWRSPDAQTKAQAASRRVTACLQAGNLPNAFGSAAEINAYMPDLPTGPLYAGDIFFHINQPLLALDFYLRARDLFRRFGGEYRTRIDTRVADAQELTGNVEAAVRIYEAVSSQPPEDPRIQFTWARAGMKAEYYRRIQARGLTVKIRHVERANKILSEFNAALLQDARYTAAANAEDFRTTEVVIRQRGRPFLDQMIADADSVAP